MKLSQSIIRSYQKFDSCKYYILQQLKGFRSEPSEAMIKGLIFERELIGSNAKDDEKVWELPKLKNGGPSQAERDLMELVELSKPIINAIKIEASQVKLAYKGFTGVADIIGYYNDEKAIIDLKYTETREDESWSEYSWGDLNKVNYIQAKMYVLLWYKMHNELLPFYYMVFGKSGWIKVIRVDVTMEMLSEFAHELIEIHKLMEAETWQPCGNYNTCRKCNFLANCTKAQLTPNIEFITL